MKEKFKSYTFWMSVTAAVILVINNIGNVFGFEVDSKVITQIVDSICGVLILFGVITMAKTENKEENGKNTTFESAENNDDSKVCKNDDLKSQLKTDFGDDFDNKKTDDKNKQNKDSKKNWIVNIF